jgi:hypothetical protein
VIRAHTYTIQTFVTTIRVNSSLTVRTASSANCHIRFLSDIYNILEFLLFKLSEPINDMRTKIPTNSRNLIILLVSTYFQSILIKYFIYYPSLRVFLREKHFTFWHFFNIHHNNAHNSLFELKDNITKENVPFSETSKS